MSRIDAGRVRLPDRRLGCGKSTLLRIVAGFEEPTTGERRRSHGKPITGPGSDRGMVFQDYALFPWMTVRQNIGFGPRQRDLPRSEIDDDRRRIPQAGRASNASPTAIRASSPAA